jgi:ABC-type transport system involved in cytochrome bd biosynthesis fused ATPase/permease subunit
MDEPTSGLDARAAAIVMRTVRNTVDTGRTVVCTIHQPSIDIFEAFDEVCFVRMSNYSIACEQNSLSCPKVLLGLLKQGGLGTSLSRCGTLEQLESN